MARWGLRARVTTTFALGALALSVVLSVVTYELVRTETLRSEQAADERQAFVSANLVRAGLRSPSPDVPALLGNLAGPAGSVPILYLHGQWYSASLGARREAVPAALRRAVLGGRAATERFELPGQVAFAVGVPMVDSKGGYFELFSLSDLAHTLDVLFLTLVAAAAATTMAGALAGRWASGRLLAPVRETARAAAAIAAGRSDTRLVASDADLVDLASSFNAMVEALQERMQRDARFASDVSHELRSPLTTIRTAVQVMERRREELPERSARALDLLAAEVDRFERLVQDLLEISASEGRLGKVSFEEVDPVELVTQSLAQGGRTDVPVEVSSSVGGLTIQVDKRRMERVIANLIENAEMHAGGVTRVFIDAGAGWVRVVVEDCGPGVPPEERRTIFERFARGSAGRRRAAGRGTGLGLSLVVEHVSLHGGKVWVEDRPGGGSRFIVELPAERPGQAL